MCSKRCITDLISAGTTLNSYATFTVILILHAGKIRPAHNNITAKWAEVLSVLCFPALTHVTVRAMPQAVSLRHLTAKSLVRFQAVQLVVDYWQWDRLVFEFPVLLWHEYSNSVSYSYFTHLPPTFSLTLATESVVV